MKIVSSITEVKQLLRERRAAGQRIGFVPTMGALHEGHLSLIDIANENSDFVLASIFVNPTQFGPTEDLDAYPRNLKEDAQKLKDRGCELLFAPEVTTMYPASFETEVKLSRTTQGLCGDHRPGHFDGVTTVVLKLFGILAPDVAVFGRKDYQQLAVIRRMVEDLCLDVEIIGAPLIREPDGLAMSSRNVYLSPDERKRALALSRALRRVQEEHQKGQTQVAALLSEARDTLSQEKIEPEYLEIRGANQLESLEVIDGPAVILVAARVGTTRLIDNLEL